MSFVLNNYQQISLFDSLGFLSERKQKILDKSWAKPFSEHIFSNIDEMMFAPLYSDKSNSRPNAPVNVIVGALILKELNGLTDDEIIEAAKQDTEAQPTEVLAGDTFKDETEIAEDDSLKSPDGGDDEELDEDDDDSNDEDDDILGRDGDISDEQADYRREAFREMEGNGLGTEWSPVR